MNVCFQCQTTEPVMWRLNGEDIDPSDGIVMDEVLLIFDIEAQFPPGVLNQLSCSSSVTSFVVITRKLTVAECQLVCTVCECLPRGSGSLSRQNAGGSL